MSRFVLALASAALCLGAGCSPTPIYTSASHSRATSARTTSSARTTTGTSGATTPSTSGGTTSTGSASGGTTTGGASCQLSSRLTDCDAGIEVRTQFYNLQGQTPVPLQAPVTVQNLYSNDTYVTDSCGALVMCLGAPPINFAMQTQVTGYVSTIFEDLHLTISADYQEIDLFPQTLYGVITSTLNNFVAAMPAVFIRLRSHGARGVGCPVDGWSFSATDLDGGLVASQAGYIEGTSAGGPPTGTHGEAMLYNLVNPPTQIRVVGTLDPNVEADAGFVPGTCTFDGGINQYTSTAHVLPGTLTAFAYDIP